MSAHQLGAIIVHGGAWNIPDSLAGASEAGARIAARAGWAILTSGGSAAEAVEAAIRSLEDDPVFDAGTGSTLNSAGKVEMDAMIMTGDDLRLGAVAAVGGVKHPISLARAVMKDSKHCLLVAEGAMAFAHQAGVELAKDHDLVTDEARQQFEFYKNFSDAVGDQFNRGPVAPKGCDTVGAVAMDLQGNVACGTSTGGITGKRVGRVGDSPLVGCGGYADNTLGAVSCTGHGESIMRVMLAREALSKRSTSTTADAACASALRVMLERVEGRGGVIMIDKDGNIGHAFTTDRMPWACISSNGERHGINPDASEDNCK